jgi:Flp pilus assembly protein TadD
MTRSLASLSLGLVLLLCASFCLTQLAEPDLHWHLLAGDRILEERRVPRTDFFSYTSFGRPWIDLHWLFQVIVSAVYRRAGWLGLDVLKITFITAAFGLSILAALRRREPKAIVAALALAAVLASQERFTLRPEALSYLMFGALLVCLDGRRRHPRSLLCLVPLLILWANMHALYAVGIVTMALVAAGDLIESRWPPRGALGGEEAPRPGWTSAVAAASAMGTLLTPYGLAGWGLPRRLLFERIATGNVYARNIAEFQAPLGGYEPTTSIGAFLFLALVVLGAMAMAHRRARPADMLLAAAFLALALLARRNIPLFALVAVPVGSSAVAGAIERARTWLRWEGPSSVPRFGALLCATLVAIAAIAVMAEVWSNRFYIRDGTQRYFGRGLAPGRFPVGAADYILKERLPGEALNDMTVGGYLAWRWFPERRVFIDGRLEVHSEALFETYLRLQTDSIAAGRSSPEVFEEVVRRYGVGIVLHSFYSASPNASLLLRHLAGGHGWVPVFIDLAGAVFVPETAATGESLPTVDLDDPLLARRLLAEASEANRAAERLDPAPAVLRRFLPLREVPVTEVNAALFFGSIGRYASAEVLFRAAIEKAPRNPILHYDLGLVLEGGGRSAEARQAYEAAMRLDGGFTAARSAYALRLLKDGDPEKALTQWAIAERSGDIGPSALRARGALLANRGRLDEAIDDYRRAIGADPTQSELRTDLALIYYRRGLRDRALGELRRAAEIDPGDCAPRAVLAQIHAGEGDRQGAEKIYREAIARDPTCQKAHLGLAVLLASSGRLDESLREASLAVQAGLDPATLSAEPALRMLAGRREFQELLSRESRREGEDSR